MGEKRLKIHLVDEGASEKVSIHEHQLIYLSDVAEVRVGLSAFIIDKHLPRDKRPLARYSFSVISHKLVMNLQLVPNNSTLDERGFGRDWVASTLVLLAESNTSQEDANLRGRWLGGTVFRPVRDLLRKSVFDDSERCMALLIRGFWVIEIFHSYSIRKTLFMSWKKKRLIIGKKPLMDIDVDGNKGMQIADIAEIRRCAHEGEHSLLHSHHNKRTLILIGGECQLILLFETKALRDKICRLFQCLIMVYKPHYSHF